MNQSVAALFAAAAARKQKLGLSYAGALTPVEARELLSQNQDAVLVDVRTKAEWAFVGKVADAVFIEWQSYPDGAINNRFGAELQKVAAPDSPVLFLCRSGARSHHTAVVAEQAGYRLAFNVLEGFEGDVDKNGHRSSVNGWRFRGLPWVQS